MADMRYVVRVDGVKWLITRDIKGNPLTLPLCPDDDLQMDPYDTKSIRDQGRLRKRMFFEKRHLKCEQCDKIFDMPRQYDDERKYVLNRVSAKTYKKMKLLDLDGELTPVAKEKVKDGDYFVTSQIMNSDRGEQVVIYAGKKDREGKTQIFINPKDKKLSFDHKDLDPTDVFVKIEATFDDNSSQTIKSSRGGSK